jgi:hypothetical protein
MALGLLRAGFDMTFLFVVDGLRRAISKQGIVRMNGGL